MKREALSSMTAMSQGSIDRWMREMRNRYPDLLYPDLIIAFCSDFGYVSRRDAEALRYAWNDRFDFCDFGGIFDDIS